MDYGGEHSCGRRIEALKRTGVWPHSRTREHCREHPGRAHSDYGRPLSQREPRRRMLRVDSDEVDTLVLRSDGLARPADHGGRVESGSHFDDQQPAFDCVAQPRLERSALSLVALQQTSFRPARSASCRHRSVGKLPVYNTIWHMLRNPMYAGGYAFGKTEARTRVVGGRARKTIGHSKPVENWTVLIRDHHSGYITWEPYDRNQALLADNAHMKSRMEPKALRGGRSLLAGLLRCRRCGRMLHVAYSGTRSEVPRYHCRGAHLNHGAAWCISFVGLRPDQAIAAEILKAVEGNAVEAAVEAATRIAEQRREHRRALALELEQAQYEARSAARRYEAVDPDNRLVAAELEARWNKALRIALNASPSFSHSRPLVSSGPS